MDDIIKQIEALSKFPSFTNNKEYMMVVEKEKEFEEIRQKIIAEIQADCQHDLIPKYKQLVLFGPKILESKTCQHCGFQPPKPKGGEYKICERCWGEMKYLGQVRRCEDRWTVYQCTVCNNTSSHT